MSQSPVQRPSAVIPIQIATPPSRTTGLPLPPPLPLPAGEQPIDTLGRPLTDLRISVTDRCNFRCGYCMPRSVFGRDHAFLPHAELLSFEEITQVARVMLSLGVRKLRLTGGEPLLRKELERLVAQLAALRTLDGRAPELTLTTNGSLLARKAQALRDAGLDRVTVSLDALDPDTFQRMSDTGLQVEDVLAGIDVARSVGLSQVKVNMVVQKGVNDAEILPMARHFRGTGIELRFIEFMDVGATNGWQMDHVLSSEAVRDLIHAAHPLQPADAHRVGATAERWAYADGAGHVGFVSSVTQAFCGDCSRLRLSTDGRLYTCLFASHGHDLRTPLRDGQDEATLRARVAALWAGREDRYSVLRGQGQFARDTGASRVEMSFIGG